MMKLLLFFIIQITFFSFVYAQSLYKTTARSGLILREQPNTNAHKITSIPYNKKVRVLNSDGPEDEIRNIKAKWFQVEYNEKIGWAFSGFLKLISDSNITGNTCKHFSGNYSTVSESEWNYELILKADCSYELRFQSHYWDEKGKTIYENKNESGSWTVKSHKIKLSNLKGKIKKMIYHNNLSLKELGESGSLPGVVWKNEKDGDLNFWKFPENP